MINESRNFLSKCVNILVGNQSKQFSTNTCSFAVLNLLIQASGSIASVHATILLCTSPWPEVSVQVSPAQLVTLLLKLLVLAPLSSAAAAMKGKWGPALKRSPFQL